MVWITADQSQINLDFSPVRMLTMWLLRTSYKSYYEYTVVVLYSECDHENNQSTHICMNHTKTQKLLRPIKDFGDRIFTTTAVQGKN